MNLDPNEVVQKVHDILRLDDRTKDLNWALGRIPPEGFKDREHGTAGVFLGNGSLGGSTMPSGAGAIFDVIVQLRFWSFGGDGKTSIAKVEEARDDALNAVLNVLWDKRKLDLTRVMFFSLSWETDSNFEASPTYAEAMVAINVRTQQPP